MVFFYQLTINGPNGSITCCIKVATNDVLTEFYPDDTSTSESVLQPETGGTFTQENNTLTETTINSFQAMNNILTFSASTYTIQFTNGSGTISNGTNSDTISVTFVSGCFNEGTKILCLKNNEEKYVSIEKLRKGDLVKSYNYGYRKIDLIGKNQLINNPDNFKQCMYTMKKTSTNNLLKDLTVTGGHSILVADLGEHKEKNEELFNGPTPMIEDKHLLLAAVSSNFKKVTNFKNYTYYHFCLENNGNDDERFGVWANGMLTETPSKNFFKQSHFILL